MTGSTEMAPLLLVPFATLRRRLPLALDNRLMRAPLVFSEPDRPMRKVCCCQGVSDLPEFKTFGLFIITALAEILGCYLPYLWLREGKTIWLLVPGALSLVAFVWLLSLHPMAAGRVYAAYGGVYIFMAIVWLWTVNGIRPTTWDIVGSAVALLGMAIIMFAPRTT